MADGPWIVDVDQAKASYRCLAYGYRQGNRSLRGLGAVQRHQNLLVHDASLVDCDPVCDQGQRVASSTSADSLYENRLHNNICCEAYFSIMGRVGVEPTTLGLKGPCSTTELPALRKI